MRTVLTLPFLRHRPARLSFWTSLSLMRSRRAVQHLSDSQLRDVGLTRAEAQTEGARPFWDAPASWKC